MWSSVHIQTIVVGAGFLLIVISLVAGLVSKKAYFGDLPVGSMILCALGIVLILGADASILFAQITSGALVLAGLASLSNLVIRTYN